MITLLLIMIIRALRFRPEIKEKKKPDKIEFDEKKSIDDFQELIRCKTISDVNHSNEDEDEFKKVEVLIKERFPYISKNASFKKIGRRGLLYHIKGKSQEHPSVLMSHFDVVSVNEEEWKNPAFEANIIDGEVWGRGVLDTKITMNGALQGLEHHLAKGFVPSDDIYLAFSGEEEIAGPSAKEIVDYFIENNVNPKLVLDEGGAVVEGVFPGVTKPCAVVGIAEKGIFNLKYTVRTTGGHASTPPPHTPVGILSQACVNIENNPFPMMMSEPVKKTFDTLARHSNFVYRLIFSNLWFFKPILDKMGKKSGGQINAMLRTTVAFTQMEGSKGMNVMPPKASMLSNQRVIPGQTVAEAVEYIKSVVNDDRVEYEIIAADEPSRVSTTDSEGYRHITDTISEVWQEALVAPYLMVACSDSRHYSRLSDKVYRFSPVHLTKQELDYIHGNNERLSIEKINKTVEFYIRLIAKL